jgi:hypothetical protein
VLSRVSEPRVEATGPALGHLGVCLRFQVELDFGTVTSGALMSRQKPVYLRQKPILYFDENFPQPIVEPVRESRQVRKYFELLSVYDFDNQRKDDEFQLAFCKVRGFVLVTLDKDFMDDRKYPIQKLPGIVVIAAPKNQGQRSSNAF